MHVHVPVCGVRGGECGVVWTIQALGKIEGLDCEVDMYSVHVHVGVCLEHFVCDFHK